MFETTFRNLDDTLRKDAGCSGEMGYIVKLTYDKVPPASNLTFIEQ
jgi:hypothetical protein